jgi:histidinol-phosphate/aromatic aminotransferase/cobyric acid decarboxylase-like protein
MLEAYPNLVIIKSLSKSYGIPGLRLGILATGNIDLINRTRDTLPIWNINSYGEFFMQIFDKHKDDYRAGLKRFFIIRKNFSDQLSAIKHLRAIPSQANYIMCEVTNRMRSKQVAETLLDQHHILIKDLSSKNGLIGRQIIRVAVKTERENTQLAKALRDILH